MRTLVAVALVVLAVVPAARADGDPASDYLLTQSFFVPFDGKVSTARTQQLRALLADAKRKGYTIRVALILSKYDLGSVPSLWRKPHDYARFLGQELFFLYKNRLLVVMPNGYGVSRRGKTLAAGEAVTGRLPAPGSGGDAIAAAAANAVVKLAAAEGVSLTVPALRSPPSRGNARDRLVILAVVLAVGGLAAGGYAVRRLRESADAGRAGHS